ncbi:hypothetical protein DFQ05_1416 [Winogradskyella wandonensis]|uniref:GLPGLI family protein n=1 Tax=Winogradskyella wandonensis TaxID=1442586 RepID=A0A4R1KSQ6_9FLAO|nr:hypothetical protein [Winogradskyella wandonensis]TCK67637.1 hypothetical protein DFQ05_1416 [Winogradskyella wandonensis]
MKYLSIVFILIFSISFCQTQEATLYFKDGGEPISGYAEIYQGYKIKFKLEENGEVSIWTGAVVKGITFHGFEFDRSFEYVLTQKFKRYPLLLELLTDGEVKLYADVLKPNFYVPVPLDGGLGVWRLPKSTKYYVKRDSELYASRLKGNFKKSIREYFGNCIGIEKRIKNHQFRWATLPELVEYYNNYCVDF